jgi:hypothetical protein
MNKALFVSALFGILVVAFIYTLGSLILSSDIRGIYSFFY